MLEKKKAGCCSLRSDIINVKGYIYNIGPLRSLKIARKKWRSARDKSKRKSVIYKKGLK